MSTCTLPLQNYKNGRFCSDHSGLQGLGGIIPCGRPVSNAGSLTCNNKEHEHWHARYQDWFRRLTFPGVQRVLQQQAASNVDPVTNNGQEEDRYRPQLQVEAGLPALGGTAGHEVVHTFQARSVYCIETVQWACGFPIGWGKCYHSESGPQVLSILDRIWEGNKDRRPSYIAYDDACDLLRHIVTQNPNNPWLHSTKFIVDAWHYIGH